MPPLKKETKEGSMSVSINSSLASIVHLRAFHCCSPGKANSYLEPPMWP